MNNHKVDSTERYVWSTKDFLGKGAFGQVYKGYDRVTGLEVALKTFGSMKNFSDKESEMLKKLEHNNIVRLYGVDVLMPGNRNVIAMELCNGGNLHDILDDPEYSYGFDEEGFKLVLSHISNGMNYLHAHNIVHRDLKPGNIMRSYREDGTVIYKLADFGAARELKESEQFQSLVGTPEYLHPDIYAAYQKCPNTKHFDASIDLWSLGVTLYHLATGSLPFRPYGGVRKNSDGMMRILEKKPPGMISGIQKTRNGEVEWTDELPKTCGFCQSFSDEISIILSGILEGDMQRVWTFQRYFAQVRSSLSKRVVHIFHMTSSSYQPIYISPDKCVKDLKEMCERYVKIGSNGEQKLIQDGCELKLSITTSLQHLPPTSHHNPLLIITTFDQPTSYDKPVPIPHTCKPPKVVENGGNDAQLSKVCAGTIFNIKNSVERLLVVENLIRLSADWFTRHLKNEVSRARSSFVEMEKNFLILKNSLLDFEDHYRREASLLNSSLVGSSFEANLLTQYFSKIQKEIKLLRETETRYRSVKERLELVERCVSDDSDAPRFADDRITTSSTSTSSSCDDLLARISTLAQRCRDVYLFFKRHKHYAKMKIVAGGGNGGWTNASSAATSSHTSSAGANHEAIVHKRHKERLDDICKSAVRLFTDESVKACKRLHKDNQAWFGNMAQYEVEACLLQVEIGGMVDRIVDHSQRVRNLQGQYRTHHDRVERSFKAVSSSNLMMVGGNNQQLTTSSNELVDDVRMTSDDDDLTRLMEGIGRARSSLDQVASYIQAGDENIAKLEHFMKIVAGVDGGRD